MLSIPQLLPFFNFGSWLLISDSVKGILNDRLSKAVVVSSTFGSAFESDFVFTPKESGLAS